MLIQNEPQYYTCILWCTFSKFIQTLKLHVCSHWSCQLPPIGNNKQLRYPNLRLPRKQLWIARDVSLYDWKKSIKWSCTWVQTTNSDYIKKKLFSPLQRHHATSRNFAGSIPDDVIGIFHWHNPSGRTMALGSTQPLTEMSTRGKGGRCVGLKSLPPLCANCLEIWEPHPPGTLWPVTGLIYLLPYCFNMEKYKHAFPLGWNQNWFHS